jgi:hypothetical protein
MSPLCTPAQYAIGFALACVVLGLLAILAVYLDRHRH